MQLDDRVAALERYDVLDREPPAALRALVDLATRVSGVPKATINLITDTEQVQIVTAGFEGGRVAREKSMCEVTITERRPLLLPDASLDRRFEDIADHAAYVAGGGCSEVIDELVRLFG